MKKTYYLFNPGQLERKDNTLKFTPVVEDGNGEESVGAPRYLPVEDINECYVFGSLRANSSLFNFLGQKDIAVHFFDYYENYTGSFMPKDSLLSGRMLLAQTSAFQNKKKRLLIAQKFIESAAYNMIKNLQYYNRRGKDMEDIIDIIKGYAAKLRETVSVDELMGTEGMIRQTYYDAFNLILNDFEMGNRTKQPPQNEVNALISFGNMMCYTLCLRAIHQTQLNPTISFLHTPGERRYSLALDIAEVFKPVIIDRVIFKVLNKREIQEKHFDKKLNKCLLNHSGKKIFVKAIEDKLLETIKHRTLNRNVSYRHLIKLECYKLAKHLLEIEEYKPFKMYWESMYVILVYDCGERRVAKMLKLCRKYLNWIQNSVFEGEISEVRLKKLLYSAKEFMDESEDSIIIFKGPNHSSLEKEVVGKERCSIDNFL